MDIAFEILTPRETIIPELYFQTPSFEWQGQVYPQGLRQCAFGTHFLLFETPIPNHINAMLSPDMRCVDWQCFSIRGDGLSLLKGDLSGQHIDWQGKGLPQLLYAVLAKANKWIVVFEINCDQIDKVVKCEVKSLLSLIKSSLDYMEEGFLAVSA